MSLISGPKIPTRFPGGLSVAALDDPLHNISVIDKTRYITYFNDFFDYVATDWVVTSVDGGTDSGETYVISSEVGSALAITTNDADNDAEFLQLSSDGGTSVLECFSLTAGKQVGFRTRFKVDDATQSDLIIGLQVTDTSPLAVVDGIYFRKDDGDANLDFVVIKDSTATTESAITTLADDTLL